MQCFDDRALLPSSSFLFYTFISENVHRILITPKTSSLLPQGGQIYGQFCLSGEKNYYVLTKKRTGLVSVQKPLQKSRCKKAAVSEEREKSARAK